MKTMSIKAFTIAGALLMVVGCQKETDELKTPVNPSNATNLGTLVIDQDFNWSSSLKGMLTVQLSTKDDIHTEGQPVQIVTKDGTVLERSTVKNGEASFYLHLPQATEAYIYYPNTGDSKLLTGTGTTILELTSAEEALSGKTKSSPIATRKSSMSSGTNLLKNSAFNDPSAVVTDASFNASSPTPVDGKWYISTASYELNTTIVPNDTVLKLSLDGNWLYWGQSVDVVGGATFSISSLWININRRIVVRYYDSNDNYIGVSFPSQFGNQVGGQHSGVIPANAAKALVYSSAYKNAYVDDVKFISSPAANDADGDGVPDDQDDFPNDPNKAYLTSFPSLGNQFLAFEDLWPNKGDFDFNDMVLQNYILYTRNAQNELVEATFHITLNALGAGINNGLGVLLLDGNKQPFNGNIISSTSGDASAHSTLTNGLVVFNDAHAAQSTYYTNTGFGPDGDPEMFQFTVTFAPNTVTTLVPDFFIFRSNDISHEIHLDGFTGTAAANTSLANTGDDHNGTYNTAKGLPWAIELVIPGEFLFFHPLEKVDMLVAYPQFQSWAQSNGTLNTDWYLFPANNKVFQ